MQARIMAGSGLADPTVSGPSTASLGEALAGFGREAFDVLGLLKEEALRDQQRKGRVHVSGGFEPAVKLRGDVFPERPAVGPHDEGPELRVVLDPVVDLFENARHTNQDRRMNFAKVRTDSL